ncbi:hypothetical protein ACFVHQ_21720 [Actinomycetes bacterium NPDC127524]
MNLLNDLEEIIQSEFKRHGYNVKNKNLQGLLNGLMNLKGKLIIPKPRKVRISKELLNKNLVGDNRKYLNEVKRKIEQGININNHLSRDSEKISAKDSLLYDWGIQHGHLNNKVDEEGRIKRSGYLLFFIVREDQVYFIDVTQHQLQDRTEFSQQQLLKIAKGNWPELFKNGLKGITIPNKLSDKDYKDSRNKGSLVPVEVDGDVYAMLGGGYSTAKTSLKNTLETDYLIQFLLEIEASIKKSHSILFDICIQFGIQPIQNDFKLSYDEENFYVIETSLQKKQVIIENLHEDIFFLDKVLSWKKD